MKPERVDLRGVRSVERLAELVLQTRAREVGRLAGGLHRRESRELHALRIACKRLRYAAERFAALDPPLGPFSRRLAQLQDALGEARDRDVLLAVLPPTMTATARNLQRDRDRHAQRASALYAQLEQSVQALGSHRIARGSDCS